MFFVTIFVVLLAMIQRNRLDMDEGSNPSTSTDAVSVVRTGLINDRPFIWG